MSDDKREYQLEFYAYETIGHTPLDPQAELVARIQNMLQDRLKLHVGEQLDEAAMARIQAECAATLQQFHPSIHVSVIPGDDVDRVHLRLSSDDPTVTQLFQRIAENGSQPEEVQS